MKKAEITIEVKIVHVFGLTDRGCWVFGFMDGTPFLLEERV